MKAKSVSIILFILGIAYMIIDGWLLSFWFVPDYANAGPTFISGNSFYSSTTFFTFWALSVPLGSIITALGLALYMRLEKLRLLIFIVCSLGLLAFLGFWSQSILYPVIFGVGGGLILFAFCISIWSLVKTRMMSKRKMKTVLDLRAVSYILFVITAWGMCGLLGVPSFGLRPEQLLEYKTHGILISMGVKVLVCFTLGWILLAWSQYMEYLSHKQEL